MKMYITLNLTNNEMEKLLNDPRTPSIIDAVSEALYLPNETVSWTTDFNEVEE